MIKFKKGDKVWLDYWLRSEVLEATVIGAYAKGKYLVEFMEEVYEDTFDECKRWVGSRKTGKTKKSLRIVGKERVYEIQ